MVTDCKELFAYNSGKDIRVVALHQGVMTQRRTVKILEYRVALRKELLF